MTALVKNLEPFQKQALALLEGAPPTEFVFFPTTVTMLRCCAPGCHTIAKFNMTEATGKFQGFSPCRRLFDSTTLPAWPVCEHHGVMFAEALEYKGIPWGFGMEGEVTIEAFGKLRLLKS